MSNFSKITYILVILTNIISCRNYKSESRLYTAEKETKELVLLVDLHIIEYELNNEALANIDWPSTIMQSIEQCTALWENNGAPTDPWGQNYEFQVSPEKITVLSRGPDQKLNTDDDIYRELRK